MCYKWINSSRLFKEWSINNGWVIGLTIDRIDNNGNYCPENCRWVTMKEQCNNRRTNRLITYNEQIYNIAQWAEKLNANPTILRLRINRGWSIKECIEKPINKYCYEYQRTN